MQVKSFLPALHSFMCLLLLYSLSALLGDCSPVSYGPPVGCCYSCADRFHSCGQATSIWCRDLSNLDACLQPHMPFDSFLSKRQYLFWFMIPMSTKAWSSAWIEVLSALAPQAALPCGVALAWTKLTVITVYPSMVAVQETAEAS